MRVINRNERRRNKEQESEQVKLQKWFKSWNPSQMKFHKAMIEKTVDEVEKLTEKVLDSCYISAILEELDIDLKECENIAIKANENMKDVKNIIEQNGEGYFMKVNDKELRSQIREEAKKAYINGENGLKKIKELAEKYKLPFKDVHIIWAEGRDEVNKEPVKSNVATEKEKEDFIKSITKGKSKKTKKTELPYTEKERQEKSVDFNGVMIKEKDLEAAREITIEEAAKLEVVKAEFKAPTKLKIINRTIEVEGQYGTYLKTEKGITTEQIFVKDIKDLEEYKKAVESEYSKGKDELDKRLKELQEERNKLDERVNKNFAIIEEIEQVFSM